MSSEFLKIEHTGKEFGCVNIWYASKNHIPEPILIPLGTQPLIRFSPLSYWSYLTFFVLLSFLSFHVTYILLLSIFFLFFHIISLSPISWQFLSHLEHLKNNYWPKNFPSVKPGSGRKGKTLKYLGTCYFAIRTILTTKSVVNFAFRLASGIVKELRIIWRQIKFHLAEVVGKHFNLPTQLQTHARTLARLHAYAHTQVDTQVCINVLTWPLLYRLRGAMVLYMLFIIDFIAQKEKRKRKWKWNEKR